MLRTSQTGPHETVFFLHGVDRGLSPCRRRLIRVRGDAHASPRAVIFPAVIRTRETIVGDAAARKPGAAMETQVVPCVQAFGVSPKNEFMIQEAHRLGLVAHLVGSRDYMPIV